MLFRYLNAMMSHIDGSLPDIHQKDEFGAFLVRFLPTIVLRVIQTFSMVNRS